jgi:hypothetical protein
VGRIYEQAFIDTYTKLGFAKLCDRETPITAADLHDDRIVPLFDHQDLKLRRELTDRGPEFCRIWRAGTSATAGPRPAARKPTASSSGSIRPCSANSTRSPSACESKAISRSCTDPDVWMASYNEQRSHQGRWCYGKTPMQTFIDSKPIARGKMLNAA